jgi:uncharacterized protein YjcR
MIWETPLTIIGESLGVSANTIKHWCVNYGLVIPDAKYRGRMVAKTLIDYQI